MDNKGEDLDDYLNNKTYGKLSIEIWPIDIAE